MSAIIYMVIAALSGSSFTPALMLVPMFYTGQLIQIFLEWKMLETDDYKVSLMQLGLVTVVLVIAFPFAGEWMRRIEG
ncbi:hypothetical protein [Jeotgalibacillus terrae]|uniref:Uncharacterized protein n=1 Tax=Jeotgalibacillus terrae TaxID=587735 RepID=A0ABW5ZHL3_9BACL|nr:hypothetical protein [Jeotgalibacillus terrae]MBM7578709.1 hypothetical protein [Jeotgalibacillus terrae]